MLSRRGDPFPLEATRDLLGLVRAFYRSTSKDERVKRAKLQAIGERLRTAIELAGSPHGSLGHRAAWAHAEQAVRELGELAGPLDRAQPIVDAAVRVALRRVRAVR